MKPAKEAGKKWPMRGRRARWEGYWRSQDRVFKEGRKVTVQG